VSVGGRRNRRANSETRRQHAQSSAGYCKSRILAAQAG
jgi:hypothetical protein